MSAPRLAAIPFEHVEAEIGTFPIASQASFELGATSLEPLVAKNGRSGLWCAAERDVLYTLPSVPMDEALTVRDRLWFDGSNANNLRHLDAVPLHTFLFRLATDYLDTEGRPIEGHWSTGSQTGTPGPAARLRWSWMCRAIPPDLLRTARGLADPDSDPFCLSPSVRQMLQDRGFAETHLHSSASLDFSLGWASLMRTLVTLGSKATDFESIGATFRDGRYLNTWLLYSAMARLLLARWLFAPASRLSSSFLDQSLLTHGLDAVEQNRLTQILFELQKGKFLDGSILSGGRNATEQLSRGFAQTRALYRRLIPTEDLLRDRHKERRALRGRYSPENREDVYANDPLARIVGWQPTERVSPETLFVSAGLRYLDNKHADCDFTQLFWQVIRLRCILYRHVVQRPLTPGLQWFVRFFARIKPLRKGLSERVLTSTAEQVSGRDYGLRSLELRLGTESGASETLAKIQQVESALFPRKTDLGLGRKPVPLEEDRVTKREAGVLFHFSRKRGGGWERGSMNAHGLDHSYPGIPRNGTKPLKVDAGNPAGLRFSRFYLEQRQHAQALVTVFRNYPSALRTVRGVDVCTDEAGVPAWVMAPLIQWVWQAGRHASGELACRGTMIPPLRKSVHAGEDFVHLATGLRLLDEAITHFRLEEGDRLGHAMALGVKPDAWCGRVGRVVQRREERLLDLVWEWRCYATYSEYGVGVASERLAYVRTEIVRLATAIFKEPHPPEDLLGFVDLLHNPDELGRLGFPLRLRKEKAAGPEEDSGDQRARKLLSLYLTSEEVWRRGRVPEAVDLRTIRHEEAALGQLQDGLRRKVGKLCLTIEVNPSSNLLVGDLGNFVEHPLWRLKPVMPEVNNISPLAVCIGSDDPLTFATTLPHEYQLLFDTLLLMGHSHQVAMKWIDEAREAGMQARFTIPPTAEIFESLRVPSLINHGRVATPP